ncbi:MAG: amino acid adenylation domain-containing protein [Sphingomonas sp.]|nr:MAG: amino acid adenylation domain-containing protein [Sphingomonas sp.]
MYRGSLNGRIDVQRWSVFVLVQRPSSFPTGQEEGHAMRQEDIAIGAIDAWRSITDIFEAHAHSMPDALAIEAQGERRTYAELAARVDLFAARLANRLGAGRENLVGVCLARDVDLPAWLLAILKVGAAYLPIDPVMPAMRVCHLLEDARPALIVASRRYAAVVAQADVPVILAEDDTPAPPAPSIVTLPDMLAYVIFTSGSTGRPKGVEIEHKSLVALMATMAIVPGFAAGEKMLGLTRISFDLSVPDMFLPFFVGGSLALVEIDIAADPERLAAEFDAYRPDVVQGTPSTWRALIEGGWRGQDTLRIFAGGEAVTRALADHLLPLCKEVWNMYGPTETTVWSTSCRVHSDDGVIPVGWPTIGVGVHVLDGNTAPVPIGKVGEIVIDGIGVARGYRNRPDLTAERFITLPGGERAYRTGDLGRFGDEGALYCLGRLDDQVKLRGFRIELGDIEAALALHPSIAWCAVKLWTDPLGEPVLIGYLVPRPGNMLASREVKAFLATRIPSYMIPDRIETVAVMPLTQNGKVDRAALPDPVLVPPALILIHDTVEVRLAAIWRDLLGIAPIEPQDDFFDLGGYSLMTVRLKRRIEAAFGVNLALIEMMRHSTLTAMATRIERGDTSNGSTAMLLNAGGTRPPLFWLDAGPLMRTIMRDLSADQPAFALNIDSGDEDVLGAGDLSLVEVATRLRIRLAGYQPTGPYYIGGWCRWGIVAFELARQLVAAGENVALLVLLDAERPGWRKFRLALRTRIRTWLRPILPPAEPVEPPSFSQRVEIATWTYVTDSHAGDVLLLRPEASGGDAGWGSCVTGDLEIAGVPGDHITMVRNPFAQGVAARIDEALKNAQRRSGGAIEPILAGDDTEQPSGERANRRSDVLTG